MNKENLKKYLKYFLIVAVLISVIYLIFNQMNNSRKLLEDERNTLNKEISNLKKELQDSRGLTYTTRLTRDSLFTKIRPYMPYESMVKSTAQRDSIAQLLPLNYGDMVMILPDSTTGIIEGIVFGGNQYESYVRYKVLLKNKTYDEVNPTQVIQLRKKVL
jgi:hypothetical protein